MYRWEQLIHTWGEWIICIWMLSGIVSTRSDTKRTIGLIGIGGTKEEDFNLDYKKINLRLFLGVPAATF